jgi:acetyl esterase/lipase
MPLHPCFADKLHLLEGMVSIEAALTDPEQAPRLAEYMSQDGRPPAPDADIRDEAAAGPHGPVRVRVYSPRDDVAGKRPGLVWVHGGAFRMGSIDDPMTDAVVRELCARAGAVVVHVDYRLAVGGVCYPVPHDDVVAALRWTREHAGELGIAPERISVGGDSAGANLSAGAVLRLRDDDRWTPAALLLVVPTLHPVLPPLSASLRAAVADLPRVLRFLPHDVADMHRNYLGGPETGADGYAMPGLAELDGLGPTLVVNAEYDDLRASGEAFVASAARAGVDVQQVTAPGMLHGFLFAPTSIEPVARLYDLLAATVRGCASDHPG